MKQNWLILTFVLTLCAPLSLGAESAEEAPPAEEADRPLDKYSLLYVSDYFSFVGKDEQGRVAFALDNNRGRDGDQWQAEHFVVMHVEGQGWVKLKGSGTYANTDRKLLGIPDSETFEFQGAPSHGFIITSSANGVTLRIGPIAEQLSRTEGAGLYRMGSAPAVLAYGDRVLEGRVIHEHLVVPDFNRLSRVYAGLFDGFQGFYVATEAGQDLYLHSQGGGKLTPLVGKRDGFLSANGTTERLTEAVVTVMNKNQALGTYRWPNQWQIQWQGSDGERLLELNLSDHEVMSNWVVGGFSMGIVTGELRVDGQMQQVYGLAELIM